jgi:hypothetical protein
MNRTRAWDPAFHWTSPLFESVAPFAARFEGFDSFPAVDRWNDLLRDRVPVRFELQRTPRKRDTLDPRMLYDARIALDGVVPSRAGSWHDFLNALVWAAFPRSKRALHTRQHRAIVARIEPGATRLPPARTRELDALALLDEGGVLRDGVRTRVFGHAVLEGLVHGAPIGAACAATLPCTDDFDATLAQRLQDPHDFLDPISLDRVRPIDGHWVVLEN